MIDEFAQALYCKGFEGIRNLISSLDLPASESDLTPASRRAPGIYLRYWRVNKYCYLKISKLNFEIIFTHSTCSPSLGKENRTLLV
jgi:hypothetical protein